MQVLREHENYTNEFLHIYTGCYNIHPHFKRHEDPAVSYEFEHMDTVQVNAMLNKWDTEIKSQKDMLLRGSSATSGESTEELQNVSFFKI